jgi:hypothetical protein
MANSLIDFSVVNPEASGSFLKGFQGAQESQQALAQQQRQNALADLQLRGAQRGEEEALAEREAYKNQDPLAALRAAGLNKQALAYEKQQQEQKAAQIKQAEEELKIGRGIAERAFAAGRAASMSAPGTEKAAVLSVLKQYHGRGIDLSQDLNEIAGLPDAQVLEHLFNRSQELKNLSDMIAIDIGSAVIRTPRFQQPGMPAAQSTPATVGMPAEIPGQTPGGRIAGTNALALPTPGGAMPAAQPYAVPGGGMMYRKEMSQAQTAADARAREQMAQSERHFQENQAKLDRPIFNAAAGGFITPPTKDNPQGKFTPATDIQTSKDQQAAIKALQSAGYDPVTGKDNISELISKSTSGGLQAGSAAALAFFGKTTEGRKAISALEGTANQIATDLAGGKLGAGISNTDREFIVGALGDVSNPMKTAEERLAGWTAAKERMVRVGLIPAPKPRAPAAASAAPSNIDALLNKYK